MFVLFLLSSPLLATPVGYNSMSESGSPLSSASGSSVATAGEVSNSPTVCLDAGKVCAGMHGQDGQPVFGVILHCMFSASFLVHKQPLVCVYMCAVWMDDLSEYVYVAMSCVRMC